ncbi:glycosyltransferase [Pedobacter sp. HMF7647]|uniref:Glycosyltransferase n=1 Tax=Hufsiella arboris TaxID=2695275 RepID=A0A7K1Y900_9SPHI|nr:glycosyltransferase family 4 protein [Hufsiella arboris]MXV51055.1 glycosyltransferase [Hufsiella arboris]
MKILILTNQVPFPPVSGYPIVVYNTIKGLLARGADVTVFSLKNARTQVDAQDPILSKIQFVTATINPDLNWFRLMMNFFGRKSIDLARFYQSAPASKFRNFLKHNEFDVIQIEGLFVMPYLSIIKQISKAKVVYRAHNLEHQVTEGMANATRSPFMRIYFRKLAQRLNRFELENLNKPDAVITISKADESQLRNLGCTVLMQNFPASIDLSEYIADDTRCEFPSIFHIGSLASASNVENLEWFIRNVWSDLKNLNSGLRFHIASRDIPDSFYQYENEDVILYKDVGDAHQFINSKSIMIVPLRTSSGLRIRIIEGMALKKCIISTSLGAEGIDYQHGKNILIADTPNEFYKYILQCITDRKFAEKIGENARRLIEKQHNLESGGALLMDFYASLSAKSEVN